VNFLRSIWFPILLGILIIVVFLNEILSSASEVAPEKKRPNTAPVVWRAPDISGIGNDSIGQLIHYGKELIANTSLYFGPRGSVAKITNGMNCQNCHIEAGAKPFGNCFSAVASTYPVYRPRSGMVESIEFRVNDCLLRSLDGSAIDSTSKEMRAMVAYLKWLGKEVPKGTKPTGAGLEELSFLDRAADLTKGKVVYEAQCQRCHAANGEGQLRFDSLAYAYPPLWGPHSYNTGAGMYRITKLAAYVKSNMPFGVATHDNPQLTNEEAWDVAAFINSQARVVKKFSRDWPDIRKKSIDYPYGPYADSFSETQHKYGPFEPIRNAGIKVKIH
jgi:thiosulfate dehydrogenase